MKESNFKAFTSRISRTGVMIMLYTACWSFLLQQHNAEAQSNMVLFVSAPGDYIGGGQTYLTFDDNFVIGGSPQTVNAEAFGFGFVFDAPGGENLVPGIYGNTMRFPFNAAGPGLDISGNGRGCNRDCGSFQLLEFHVDGNGKPDRLWLKYTNSCECGMPLQTGEIRYHSTLANVLAPPVFVEQPADQTVVAGKTAIFSVAATGTQPLSYQWKHAGTNLPGAISDNLQIPNVSSSDAGSYTVLVSNSVSFVTSDSAILNLLPSAACVNPPSGLVALWSAEGNTKDSVSGNPGNKTGQILYQPGKVGLAFSFPTQTGYVLSDSTAPGLQFGANDFSIELWANFTTLSGTQALIAKDDGQGQQNKWILWVADGKLQLSIARADSSGGLVLGDASISPALNTWHHLAVVRQGYSYSFYVDGVLASTGTSTTSIPTIAAPITIGAAEGLFYMTGLEDEISIYDRALSTAEVRAIYNADSAGKCAPPLAPYVVTQPQGKSVFAGATVQLEVLAAGTAPLSYQWNLDNTMITGATNAVLVLTNLNVAQGGNYSVAVMNPYGSTNSETAVLNVLTPGSCIPVAPDIISWWSAEYGVADSVGGNPGVLIGGAELTGGKVGGAFDLSSSNAYVRIPDKPNLALGSSDFTIELWANFQVLGGSRALISKDDGSGQANKWIFWLNNGKLQFSIRAQSTSIDIGSATLNPGLNIWHHFAVTRSGSLFTLFVDGAPFSSGQFANPIPSIAAPVTIGQAENSYFMGGFEDEVTLYSRALSSGEIQAIYAAGSAGKCQTSPPVIQIQPFDQTVVAGSSPTFVVTAFGQIPMSFQWRRNGDDIPGATNSAITLTNVMLTQAGNYTVHISNAAGSTNSASALLDVLPAGSCLEPPANIVSWWSGEGTSVDLIGLDSGILAGGVQFGPGKVGQGFALTNGTSYIEIPNRASQGFTSGNFTIELWANFTTLSGSRVLVGKDEGPGNKNKWFYWSTGGKLQFYWQNGATPYTVDSSAFSPTLNAWHHLAIARNSSIYSFYVDGDLVSTATNDNPIPAISGPLTIGAAEELFNMGGFMDEVTIYGRALSSIEIFNINKFGSGGKCIPPLPPMIVTQPVSRSVFAGQNVEISVGVFGSEPFSYQWHLNGVDIPSATNATLSLMNVQTNQAGNYSVSIGNANGATNSSDAQLTVLLAGECAVPQGVVSWWQGEGNALDFYGVNSGVLKGGAVFAPGKVGAAFAFTNGLGYVQIPDSPGFAFGTNSFTIELWANFTSLTGTRALVAKDVGPGENNKWIFWRNSGQLQFFWEIGATTYSVGSGAFVPELNTWHHIALTRSGSLFSFYVDGVLISSDVNSTVIPSINAQVTFGQAESLYYMGGLEDEVALYSRALDASEILTIYRQGAGGKCNTPISPLLLTQPLSQTVISGVTATFSVVASGAPLGYQWSFNGTNISPTLNPTATNATLVITNTQMSLSGNYQVTVGNGAGSTNSSIATLTVQQPGACASVPGGLVGWWQGEGSAVDFTGTNSGTLQSGVTFSSGEVGQAFSFVNGAGYVLIPDSPSLSFGSQDFTIELWANFTSLTGNRVLMSKSAGAGNNSKWIFWKNNGQLQFYWQVGSIGHTVGSAAFNPSLNVWHHLAVTRSGSLFSIYVDGVLTSIGTDSTAIPAISAPLIMGQAEGTYPMGGLEDEVSIYNRALSAGQIQTIYRQGGGGKCSTVSPIVLAQPAGLTVFAGMNISFSVAASGAPLAYQWSLNGTNISSLVNATATNDTLVITNVQFSHAGNYQVSIGNTSGSTNSMGVPLVVIPAGSCLPAAGGIVSTWSGEGTPLDGVGNNNGTLQSGAGFADGKVGQAFAFTNGAGYVQIPGSPSLTLSGGDFTIELWANFTPTTANRVLIGKSAGSGNNDKWMFWRKGTQLQFYWQTGSDAHTAAAVTFSPGLNTWHHLAVVRKGITFSILIDGVLSTSALDSGSIPAVSAPLTIGQVEGGSFQGGYEDEVSIYNRALSPIEVQAIYLAGASGKCSPSSMPMITRHPSSQTLFEGATATFSAVSSGTSPISYQWLSNGTNIPGATASTLVITNVQLAMNGTPFAVKAINVYGMTQSSNAFMTVLAVGACLPPPAGLVSWWAAEGNASDQGGLNPGTFQGAPVYGIGKVARAFDFTDNSSYVQIADSPSLYFGSNDFTIELWANFISTGGQRALIAKDVGPGTNNKWIFWLNNIQLQFMYQNGGGSYSVGTGGFNPLPNTWHHLAVTRNGLFFTIYIDGAVSSTGTGSAPIPVINAPVTIGQAEGSLYMGGFEDEVAIYDRALTSTEIQAIYKAGSTGKCGTPVPPVVFASPDSATVFAGDTARFRVVATGSEPLAYQWKQDGVPISTNANPSAQTSTLVLTNAQAGLSGKGYSVSISNAAGTTNTSPATLTVLPADSCLPPPSGIIGWWAAEGTAKDTAGTSAGMLMGGAGYASGVVGQAFDFSSGTGVVEIPDKPAFALGTNDFSIELWAKIVNPYGSRALIAKDSGSGNNNKWIFWINGNQLQFYWLSGTTAYTAGAGTFTPDVGTWHHLAVTRKGNLFTLFVDGATNSTATISAAIPAITAPVTIGQAEGSLAMGGLEDEVCMYNKALSANEIQAIYIAGSRGKCSAPFAPEIVSQPQGKSVFVDADVAFNVQASGSPTLTYQWKLNGMDIPGATNKSLALTRVQTGQSGTYSVVVGNPVGTTNSANAMLSVNIPVCTPAPGGLVSWWQGEGTPIDSTGTNNGVLKGAATYAKGKVDSAFDLTGASSYMEVADSTNLNFGPNDFTIELWANFAATNGNRALISKNTGSGNTAKWIFWERSGALEFTASDTHSPFTLNGAPLNLVTNTWHHFAITRNASNFTLYVDGALYASGTYSTPIAAINAPVTIGVTEGTYLMGGYEDEIAIYDRALSAAEILAQYNADSAGKCRAATAPLVYLQPKSQSAFPGTAVSFRTAAAGSQPLAYQWRFKGDPISPAINPTATNEILVLQNLESANAGAYVAVVSNPQGSATSSVATLTVLIPPTISPQPMGAVVRPGCTVTFVSGASGPGLIGYQWRKNGTNLSGQISASLTLMNVQMSDFGSYALVATNSSGSVTSSVALLALDQLPVAGSPIIQRYSSGGVKFGLSMILNRASDADGDIITLSGISSNSFAGGTVKLNGDTVEYIPPAGYDNADAFNYMLSDGHCGGTVSGTVLVVIRTDNNPASQVRIARIGDGSVRVVFDGIPNMTYRVQRTDSLVNPNWQDAASLTADNLGTYIFTDWPATNGPTRFYRSVSP